MVRLGAPSRRTRGSTGFRALRRLDNEQQVAGVDLLAARDVDVSHFVLAIAVEAIVPRVVVSEPQRSEDLERLELAQNVIQADALAGLDVFRFGR